eukprot:jgi/Psemu1/40744/gm1.40744_g
MSMTSLSAQEEGRAFVEAAEVRRLFLLSFPLFFLWTTMEAACNTATRHCYHPEPVLQSLMLSPKPVKTPVFRAAQLHGTYFKYKDEDEVEREDIFQRLPDSSLGTNDNAKARGATAAQDPLAHEETVPLPIQRHGDKKQQTKQGTSLFEVALSHQGAKGSASKKIENADLLNTLDWLVAPGEFAAQHKLPPKYKDDNHFKQDWFMGIYMQLMTNHCPEWVDDKPTCATNFASMEFPIFARDTEDMETSAAGPDIELAQSWESPSTINSKATWDSQSHEHPRFARSHPPKGLEKILFQQSDAKTTQEESSTWADGKTQQEEQASDNMSWNSSPFDVAAGSTTSPATATTDQLRSVEGVVVTAEKKIKEEHD